MRGSISGQGKNIITDPQNFSRCITDPHMVLVFIAFLIGMGVVLVTAINEGEIDRILYGLDFTGKACGSDGRSSYKHQFWPNVLYYKQLGSVCLEDCPDSPSVFTAWTTVGSTSMVCHCAPGVASGNMVDTGSIESYTVDQSLNTNNLTSELGQKCNEEPWKSLGYYKANISNSPTNNNYYKYLTPATVNPKANAKYSDSYKLDIPICNPVYRTKKVMNRCIPWIDYDSMKTMFCGDDGDCPTDNLADEFDGVTRFFEDAIADVATAWYVILSSVIIAMLIGFCYLFFMEKCATVIIMMGLLGTLVGSAAVTFAFYVEYKHLESRVDETPQLATHDEDERNQYICLGFAILFATIFAILFCVVLCFCRQVCVAAKLLECAAEAMLDMPMLVFYPLGQVVNLLAFFAMFVAGSLFIASASTIKYNDIYGYAEADFDSELQGAFVYWLFGFLWIAEFASAVGFMVVAFCFAMWFFAPAKGGGRHSERVMQAWPICTAIKLTCCHHLGTCAAGSLIIAIIQLLRIALEYLQTKKEEAEEAGLPCMCLWDFFFCCCRCCLWCLEKCMKYVNKVAYIFTVIKGEWFCSAACSAVSTIITEFSWVVIVSCITSCMLFFGKLMTSLLVAAICGYWTSTLDVSSILVPTIFTFIIAYAIAMLFAEVYEMAIDTMLICYLHAKNRDLLNSINLPEQFTTACQDEDKKMRDSRALRESRIAEKGTGPLESSNAKDVPRTSADDIQPAQQF